MQATDQDILQAGQIKYSIADVSTIATLQFLNNNIILQFRINFGQLKFSLYFPGYPK